MPRWTSWSVQIRPFSAAAANSSAVSVNVAKISEPLPVHWTSVHTCRPRNVSPLASFLGFGTNPATPGTISVVSVPVALAFDCGFIRDFVRGDAMRTETLAQHGLRHLRRRAHRRLHA